MSLIDTGFKCGKLTVVGKLQGRFYACICDCGHSQECGYHKLLRGRAFCEKCEVKYCACCGIAIKGQSHKIYCSKACAAKGDPETHRDRLEKDRENYARNPKFQSEKFKEKVAARKRNRKKKSIEDKAISQFFKIAGELNDITNG